MANEPRVPRLLFIDNLRIALMVLVIAYHVGLAYGPGDWWYFQNPDRSPMLRPFFTVNRAFFMSLFFMISGYFLPASYDRRGAGDFLKDRLLRMGIPLVVFLLVVIPVIMYAYCLNFRNYDRLPFLVYYWKLYFGWGGRPPGWSGPSWPDMQLGHLWFVQHLLIFALCYSVWRLIRGPLPGVDREAERLPENLKIIVFILALTAVTFVVRIWYPIYKWTAFLGFIQVSFADVPRDLSFFIIGVIARYRNWFINMPKSTGIAWLAIGVASAALCFGLEITGAGCFSAGGANGLSLAHCLWESL
ncbi:MAG: acyltransferase family protein, partial [Deltaproteobacteria bacterium]|nr:acyltransferase family protein [Deltaproteobacteria bacterium]